MERNVRLPRIRKMRGTQRKSVVMSQDALIDTSFLETGLTLPLVIEPKQAGMDLGQWAAANREWLQLKLLDHGGILFRGFQVHTVVGFKKYLAAACSDLMTYTEGATPRSKLGDKVYTSTEFPPDHPIELHNELSYVQTWPMKIWFSCCQPSAHGGETPIADVRKVYRQIEPDIRKVFEEKGWMLVRNFGGGFGLSWQRSFGFTDRGELEDYCRQAEISCEWKEGDQLRTKQVRPAVAVHPVTGQDVWFNHIAFWHISSLEPKVRDLFRAEFDPMEVPFGSFYGDGEPIEDDVIEQIREAYRRETVRFPWQKGDVLMLDNMLVAHGRGTFEGERKILAAMGEPHHRENVIEVEG